MSLSTAQVGSAFWQYADKKHMKPECKIYRSVVGYLLQYLLQNLSKCLWISFPSFLLICQVVWSVLPINTLKFCESLHKNKDNIVGIQNMGMFKVRQFLYYQHYFHSMYVYDTSNNTSTLFVLIWVYYTDPVFVYDSTFGRIRTWKNSVRRWKANINNDFKKQSGWRLD